MKRSIDSQIYIAPKMKRSIDSQIYIDLSYRVYDEENLEKAPTIHNKLIVVDDAAAADSMVRISDLPDLGRHSYIEWDLAVAKSRLFLISAYPYFKGFKGILSVNIDGDGGTHWETITLGNDDDDDYPGECWSIGGTLVYGDGKLIYGIGLEGALFAFNPDTRAFQFIMSGPSDSSYLCRPHLLGVTDTKIYANCLSVDSSVLGYYDMKSLTWESVGPIARVYDRKVVIVRDDSYLIDFSLVHPTTEEFCPALYVYDIHKREWLPNPVEGLPNDGHALPSLDDFEIEVESIPIYDTSMLVVGSDEQLKLALVWRYLRGGDHNVLHLTKLTLAMDEDEKGSPTFEAKSVSSYEPYSFDGLLIRLNTATASD